jgi:hypothetical protein
MDVAHQDLSNVFPLRHALEGREAHEPLVCPFRYPRSQLGEEFAESLVASCRANLLSFLAKLPPTAGAGSLGTSQVRAPVALRPATPAHDDSRAADDQRALAHGAQGERLGHAAFLRGLVLGAPKMSGRKSWRVTRPSVASSICIARSAGILSIRSHFHTCVCLTPQRLARAVWPPTKSAAFWTPTFTALLYNYSCLLINPLDV